MNTLHQTILMPPFLLMLFLATTASLFASGLVLTPLAFFTGFHIPNLLIWGTLAMILFWCFGE